MRVEAGPSRLRPLTRDDIPAAMALVRQVGWNQTAADWMRFLEAQPDGCFAACVRGQLVGSVTTIVYDKRLAWIGMMLVDAGHRAQGIGRQLFERALEFTEQAGVSCVKLDATAEGQRLYEKFGFTSELPIERWALLRRVEPAPSFGALTEVDHAVLGFDAEVFGVDRSDVLRSLAASAPDLTIVATASDALAGYALGRHGLRADHLGPWMARDEATAELVLTAFLERSQRPAVFVDCVLDNPWSTRLAEAAGFRSVRSLTRMCRGPNPYSLRTELLGAIVGPELG